jgi:hypothetical protein
MFFVVTEGFPGGPRRVTHIQPARSNQRQPPMTCCTSWSGRVGIAKMRQTTPAQKRKI